MLKELKRFLVVFGSGIAGAGLVAYALYSFAAWAVSIKPEDMTSRLGASLGGGVTVDRVFHEATFTCALVVYEVSGPVTPAGIVRAGDKAAGTLADGHLSWAAVESIQTWINRIGGDRESLAPHVLLEGRNCAEADDGILRKYKKAIHRTDGLHLSANRLLDQMLVFDEQQGLVFHALRGR